MSLQAAPEEANGLRAENTGVAVRKVFLESMYAHERLSECTLMARTANGCASNWAIISANTWPKVSNKLFTEKVKVVLKSLFIAVAESRTY